MVFLWPVTQNREVEQIAAQIIERIEQRVAARIVMVLPKPERIAPFRQLEQHPQRVGLVRDEQLGQCPADTQTLRFL